jgi:Fe-S cluster assembly scaffold protein SufB
MLKLKNQNQDSKTDIALENYNSEAEAHSYLDRLEMIEPTDARQWLDVGVDTNESCRAGTFIQKDSSVIHSKACHEGVEIMSISQARKAHAWLENYEWHSIAPDADKFTVQAKSKPHEGYFIRVLPGVKVAHPVQSCLYIAKERFSQNVHNIVIAEEGSELHVITGCATAPKRAPSFSSP